MKKRPYRSYNGLFACLGVGLLFAGIEVVGSWLENMFYVMGPGPTAADRAAFNSDLELGMYILLGSFVLGLITTAVTQRVHTQRPQDKTIWSDVYDAELPSSEPHPSSVTTF